MSTYKQEINELLGEKTTNFLYDCIEDGKFGKNELRGLASELKKMGTYNAYNNINSVTDNKRLYAELLDKVTVNAHFN